MKTILWRRHRSDFNCNDYGTGTIQNNRKAFMLHTQYAAAEPQGSGIKKPEQYFYLAFFY
jgi:hypothetical protein